MGINGNLWGFANILFRTLPESSILLRPDGTALQGLWGFAHAKRNMLCAGRDRGPHNARLGPRQKSV